MATIVAAAGGGNWNATGTWVGGAIPTAADDVQLNASSGQVTITATAACRSLDCTGYTNTLTQNANVVLNIGDGTAGLSNIALKFVAGMAFSRGGGTAVINFISSATSVTHTIATGGIGLSSWTVNAPGATYQLLDANTVTSTMTVTLTAGTLNTNGQTCTWGSFGSNNSNTRTLTLGNSAVTIVGGGGNVWNTTTVTNLTVTANTSTVTLSGSTVTFGTGAFNYNGMSLVLSGAGTATIGSGATFNNVTRTGTATTTDGFTINGTALTATGTLTVNGNSAVNRLWLRSGTVGTAATITAAAVTMSNVDLMDITGAGAGSWNLSAITGGSGDCGGNTNITFTTAAAQTWSGTSGGNWSANAWSGRAPLPQDDVVINAAFAASQTITADMPRLGKSINWTGTTGSPTWALTTLTSYQNFGSLTLDSGMTMNDTIAYNFMGRGTFTLTSAAQTFNAAVTFQAPSGTYTLQDALTMTGALNVTSATTLTTNNQTVTAQTMTVQVAGSTMNLGSSVLNATSTASGANLFLRTNGGAVTAGAATFNVVGATSNSRNIIFSSTSLGSMTINYTVAGSPGTLVFSGALTISTLNVSDATGTKALVFPSATTYTFNGGFNVVGRPGNLITITASTGGSAATLSKPWGYVNCDYLSLQDSAATGGASWYCGYNSTRVSNVTGWMSMPWDPGRFFEVM